MMAIEMEQKAFAPGDPIAGVVNWSGLGESNRLDIRLIWYTSGKGDQDFEIVNKAAVNRPADSGEQAFSFPAPPHPHSFSGILISLTWAIEVVQMPNHDAERCEIVIAPGGREIVLHKNVNDQVSA